jgi:hypothetical protein
LARARHFTRVAITHHHFELNGSLWYRMLNVWNFKLVPNIVARPDEVLARLSWD